VSSSLNNANAANASATPPSRALEAVVVPVVMAQAARARKAGWEARGEEDISTSATRGIRLTLGVWRGRMIFWEAWSLIQMGALWMGMEGIRRVGRIGF